MADELTSAQEAAALLKEAKSAGILKTTDDRIQSFLEIMPKVHVHVYTYRQIIYENLYLVFEYLVKKVDDLDHSVIKIKRNAEVLKNTRVVLVTKHHLKVT